MSTHGNLDSMSIRRVIMPADEDELNDMHSYQDIRMELLATGHNLVRKRQPKVSFIFNYLIWLLILTSDFSQIYRRRFHRSRLHGRGLGRNTNKARRRGRKKNYQRGYQVTAPPPPGVGSRSVVCMHACLSAEPLSQVEGTYS